MASTIKIAAGIVLLVFIFPIALGGIAIVLFSDVMADDEGYFKTNTLKIENSNVSAVRVDIPVNISESVEYDLSKVITIRIEAVGANDEPVFIGLLPKHRAISYLSNISYILITDIDFGTTFYDLTGEQESEEPSFSFVMVENTTSGNTEAPSESEWIIGGYPAKKIYWSPKTDDLTTELSLIMFNSSPTGGVNINFSIGIKIPVVSAIGWVLLGFSVLVILLAMVLIWSGIKSRPTSERFRYYYGSPVVAMPQEQITVQEQDVTQVTNVKCSVCGAIVPSDSNYCPQCGEILLHKDETIDKKENIHWESFEKPKDVLVVADWSQRFWAIVIDWIIVGFVSHTLTTAIMFSLDLWDLYGTSLFNFDPLLVGIGPNSVLLFLYTIIMEYYFNGQTLGRMALNLYEVSELDGKRPNLGSIIVSAFGRSFFLPIDLLIGLVVRDDTQVPKLNQRVTQRLAKTVIIHQEKKIEEPGKIHFVSRKI